MIALLKKEKEYLDDVNLNMHITLLVQTIQRMNSKGFMEKQKIF